MQLLPMEWGLPYFEVVESEASVMAQNKRAGAPPSICRLVRLSGWGIRGMLMVRLSHVDNC